MTFIIAKSIRIFQAKEFDENHLLVYVNNKMGVKKIRKLLKIRRSL
jgi:hypothetical protein